jgi:sulfite reductase alpha subunit-like flavoprotein
VFLHGGLQRASNREGLLKAKNIRYTVLGLGDQNYSAFMEIPRQFTKQMDYLGATAFYPRGEADEVEVSQPASLRAYFIQPASLSCITQLHAPASLSCMHPHHSAACARITQLHAPFITSVTARVSESKPHARFRFATSLGATPSASGLEWS